MSKEDPQLNMKYMDYLTNSEKYKDLDKPLGFQIDFSTLSILV